MKVTLVRDDLDTEKEESVEVETGANVSELLKSKDIEPEEVLVSRNGTIISGEHELKDGDEIRVFDVIAGG